MTNDDRTDEPRFGERAPQYGEHAPQYGEHAPQQGAPTWGDQHQAQQPYAAAPASAGAPSWQGYREPKAKKKTVGVIAFVVGLAALVVAVIAGVLIGAAFGDSQALREATQSNGSATPSDAAIQELMTSPGAISASLLFYLGTALGLWAVVQGIVAAVTKRGRAWGVWAIVLAVVAIIAFFITTFVALAGAMANSGITP
ncbi:DUF2127 domain-containing protein [Curtobacterium pusillum]|uniref:DUF2127 domain-containing protein n=1 Tax=Curtobacterium pusillum TaxID=69373 RepID=UPI0011A80F3B|nr:DUF2127 domain-containing protein [Curtobacterium pusillum]